MLSGSVRIVSRCRSIGREGPGPVERIFAIHRRRSHPSKQTSFAADAETILPLLNSYFVAEELVVILVGQLAFQLLGDIELHRQLEPQILLRTAPRQVLEVSSATLDRCIEAIGNQVAQKPDHVEQRALSTRVGAYQNVEGAMEFKVHVAQTAKVQSLDASDHEESLESCVRLALAVAVNPIHDRVELEAALDG